MEPTAINEDRMADPPRCGKCGASLTAGAAEGLCPTCLFKDGLELLGAAHQRAPPAPSETSGTRIGPYKLLQRLGEGGMGAVWMAEQSGPVRRKVALKVIKPGMDSANVLARFEAERQALALMDHANIAKVFDAGATEAGRPYFVMELVKGIPFTKYCDEQRLSIRERLELFIPVCQPIQHAHQKGIIHRDLKPSNVLVAQYDGKPVPKVIDFGVAKAVGQQLTERTLFTEFGAVIGTLEYMSPEQAEFNQLDIDTRSDIYSLGVLLYQLLTGTTPLSRESVQKGALDELLRCIREQEPPRPSTRLSQSKDTLPGISAQRQLDPAQLTRLVRGDLDWIVMKALEKDRNRRYDTANSLAMDLQRHLHDEPVLARPPTAAYRLKKFARKHRVAVAAAAGFVLLLVGATAVSSGLAFWANREKARAKKSDDEARAVLGFFQDKVLAAPRPGEGRGFDVTMRAAIDLAEPTIGMTFTNQPVVEASIRDVIGTTYLALGENKKAIDQYERAVVLRKLHLGRNSPETLTTMNKLAKAYREFGQFREASRLFEETLNLQKANLGLDHPDTLDTMTGLAITYGLAGQHSEEVSLMEQRLKLQKAKRGSKHPDALLAMHHLGLAYDGAGRLGDAVSLYEETLKLSKSNPEAKMVALWSMECLARAYQKIGKASEALSIFEDALKFSQRKLGPEHLETLDCMHNLADFCQDIGRPDKALPLFEETVKLRKAKLGADHPATLLSMGGLASSYQTAGRVSDALALYQEILRVSKVKFGVDHHDTLASMVALANCYLAAGQVSEALPLLEESLKLARARLVPDHRETLGSMNELAIAYKHAGRGTDALAMFEETLKLMRAKLRSDDPFTLNVMFNLARAYRDAGRLSDALPLFEETLKLEKAKLSPEDSAMAEAMSNLAEAYLSTNRFAEAESLLRECLPILEKTDPGRSPTYNAESLLGWALLGQKKYGKAEPLLVQGYEGLKKRDAEAPSPSHAQSIKEAGERIVQLYEAWGKRDQADAWRQKLAGAKVSPQP